jgi:RNA-directed DNA polymerase
VDGTTFGEIEAAGLDGWLAGLRKDLVARSYRPAPVRRVMIPKPGGGARPLGIPTIRDRVVQTAAKLVLEPIPRVRPAAGPRTSFAAISTLRPRAIGRDGAGPTRSRRCTRCSAEATATWWAPICRRTSMRSRIRTLTAVARRIVDRHVLRLIKLGLEAPVEERETDGARRRTRGKASRQGTSQSAVISPLLAKLT